MKKGNMVLIELSTNEYTLLDLESVQLINYDKGGLSLDILFKSGIKEKLIFLDIVSLEKAYRNIVVRLTY